MLGVRHQNWLFFHLLIVLNPVTVITVNQIKGPKNCFQFNDIELISVCDLEVIKLKPALQMLHIGRSALEQSNFIIHLERQLNVEK